MLVAIQDEGASYGSPAIDALKRLGAVEPIILEYRSSFALAGYAGSILPSWIKQAQNKRGQGPSELTTTIEPCEYSGNLVTFDDDLFRVNCR